MQLATLIQASAQLTHLPRIDITPGDAIERWPGVRGSMSDKIHHYILARYGYVDLPACLYVFDHLIPVSLGGLTSVRNVWPMPTIGPWTAAMKDALENHAIQLVHHGQLLLPDVQQRFANDWTQLWLDVMN